MSIFKRVLIVCVLPLIVVLAAIVFLLNDVVKDSMLGFSKKKSEIFAAQTAKQINDGFQSMQILLKVLGGHLANINYNDPQADEYTSQWAKSVVKTAPNIYSVWYSFEPDGFSVGRRHARDLVRFGDTIIVKKDFNEDDLMNPITAPWYYFPFTTQRMWFEVADLYDYKLGAGKQYTGTVSKPIFRDGRVVGVVGVDMLYDSIFSLLDYRMMIITQRGYIAYSKNRDLLNLSILDKDFPDRDFMRENLYNGNFFTVSGISPLFRTRSRMYFYPIVDGIDKEMLSEQLFLYFDFPYDEITGLWRVQQTIIKTGILGLLLLALILFFTMKSILKPVKKLTEAADEIANGNLDLNFDSIIGEELGNKKNQRENEVFILFIALKRMMAKLNSAEKIFELSEKLKSALKTKDEFLAKMSHEIRTPMNAIFGISGLVLRKDLQPDVREDISIIKRSSENLLSVINDILDFSKIESGKLEIVPANYSLLSVVNDVVSIIKTKVAESRVEFITDIDGKIPNWLYGDETRIRQILLNILSNAAKFTEKGVITFVISGHIIDDENIILEISVNDTGKGIKPEDLQKLFGDFVQVDLAANKGIQGTGLGLSITKSLIEAMDGKINVSSVYGRGSRFTIELPQKINSFETISESALSQNSSAAESGALSFTAPTAKVLLVDDIDTNIIVAQGLLSSYEIQTESCFRGIDAVEKVRSGFYDLVFMDHLMPETDGVEATKLIREFNKDLPIIALTANAISGMREMFLENGFNDFLSKPIENKKLHKILEEWIPKEKQQICENKICSKGCDYNLPNLLKFFVKDAKTAIKTLQKTIEDGNVKLFTITVHAMKSALANIGEKELSAKADELEIAGRNEDLDFLNTQTAPFLKQLQEITDQKEEILSKSGKNNQKGDNPQIDSEVLQKLKIALENYDLSEISKTAEHLTDFKEAENILESILIGEYEKAIKEIEVLLHT